jgi:hypothetical protein
VAKLFSFAAAKDVWARARVARMRVAMTTFRKILSVWVTEIIICSSEMSGSCP